MNASAAAKMGKTPTITTESGAATTVVASPPDGDNGARKLRFQGKW
jgi:hypothetical protein